MSKHDSTKPGPLAVDLDGTLAQPMEPFDIYKVGAPYDAMLKRVKKEIEQGRRVSIFTARAAGNDKRKIQAVRDWCAEHGLPDDIEITAVKSPKFAEFWDDRARQAHEGQLATKMAAMVVLRTRIEEHKDEHCPHCDVKFREKYHPRPSDPEQFMTGDYDMVCPSCEGIIDYPEQTDEEIDKQCAGWGGESIASKLREQRDKQRARRLAREASSSGQRKDAPEKPQGGGTTKQASTIPYREGPFSTVQHGDDIYSVDDLLDAAGEPEDVPMEEIEWLLENAQPDPERVEAADYDIPGIYTKEEPSGRKVVLDGMHRMAKAKRDGRRTLPLRHVSAEQLKPLVRKHETKQAAYSPAERLRRLRVRRGDCTGCGAPGYLDPEVCPECNGDTTKQAGYVNRFHRPENYDVAERFPEASIALSYGQNDWEGAPIIAWLDHRPDSEQAERLWVNIKYPSGYIPGDEQNKLTEDREAREQFRRFIKQWIQKAKAEAKGQKLTLQHFEDALKDAACSKWVESSHRAYIEEDVTAVKASAAMEPPRTGPAAILHRLRTLDLEALEKKARDEIASGKITRRDRGVKMLNALAGLKRNELSPEDLIITKVPVIPPAFRPFSFAGGTYIPGSANELYQDLLRHRDLHRETLRTFGPSGAQLTRRNVYAAIKAAAGYGEPVSKKVRDREPKGFLVQISGTNPKVSFPQAKMLAKPVDTVGRGTITINPDLGMDYISLPRNMVWEKAKNHVIRTLVQRGMPLPEAVRSVKERNRDADLALQDILKKHPVFYSRAPAWHKFNAVGGYVQMHDGDNIGINPYVTAGLNADFDGDQVLNQLLVCIPEDAVDKWRMSYHKLDDHRVRLTSASRIPYMAGGQLFLFDLEDFPHGELQRTKQGKNGRIDFHTIPHDIFVLSYDQKLHQLVWAKAAFWSKHYAREIEIVDTHNGYQLITDDDPRAVYGTAAGELRMDRFTPSSALDCRVLIPRAKHTPEYTTSVTSIPGNTSKAERAWQMHESIELTADVGWLIGALCGDGWVVKATTDKGIDMTGVDVKELHAMLKGTGHVVTHPTSKAKAVALSDADGWNHAKLDSILPGLLCESARIPFQKKVMTSMEPGRYGDTVAYVYSSTLLAEWVRDLIGGERDETTAGSANKHLPVWFLSAPRDFRMGLFAGLMDTDGSVSVSGAKNKPQLMSSFGSTSIRLCIEMKLLAGSLGISARITPSETPLGKPCWMVTFSNHEIQAWGGLHMVNQDKLAALRSVPPIEESAVMAKYDIVPISTDMASRIKRAIGYPKITPAERKGPDTPELQRKRATQAHYMTYAQAANPKHEKFGAVSRQTAIHTIELLGSACIEALPGGKEWMQIVTNTDVTWERVVGVQRTGIREDGYDLTVPGYETFMSADGIILSNTINVHFPILPETVEEVKEKMMPSKMLFSIRDQEQVMPLPKHEAVLGLFAPQQRPAQQLHRFNSREEAVAAIDRGEVDLSDEIEYPD